MLTPALLLLVQVFTLQGKVVDDQKQPVSVTLRIAPVISPGIVQGVGGIRESGSDIVQSFSNGTFRFEEMNYGDYIISVKDARYLLKDVRVSFHDPASASQPLVISLVRNGVTPPPAPSEQPAPTAHPGKVSPEREAYLNELHNLDLIAIAGTTTAAAFEEFKKGVDIAMLGTRRQELLVPASGSFDNDSAEMHFKNAVSLAPDFYEGHFELGLEQLRQGDTAFAVTTLEHATTMNTTDPRPLRVLAELYIQQMKFEKTVDALAKLGTMSSLNAGDHYHLGVAFESLDNLEGAQQELSNAISLTPDKIPQAYLHLHNVDINLNKVPEGIAVLKDFLRLFPNDPNRRIVEDRVKKLDDLLKKQQP